MKAWCAVPLVALFSLPALAADSVSCKQVGKQIVVTSRSGGVTYALNGSARTMAATEGWQDGKAHYEPAEMLALMQQGLADCSTAGTAQPEQSSPAIAASSPASTPAPAVPQAQSPSAKQGSPLTADGFINAAVVGDIATLKRYVDGGFNVNTRGPGVPALGIKGSPAIGEAAAAGRCAAVDYLLSVGAKADPKEGKYGSTPVASAARAGATDCIRSLLAKGARPDVREEAGGDTPLILAAYYGHLEAATLLVEHGASLTVTNKDGDTPYRAAVAMGSNRVAQYLKSKGGR